MLNQHQLSTNCTVDEFKQKQLIDALKFSVRACGSMLLCCTAGPTGAPGWESPAPFSRVWCLFEVFVAITEKVGVTVRLAKKDEYEFRLALEQGGMRRVESALASLDAQKASAMVPSDRTMILEAIETSVGLDEFNR